MCVCLKRETSEVSATAKKPDPSSPKVFVDVAKNGSLTSSSSLVSALMSGFVSHVCTLRTGFGNGAWPK